MNRVCTVLTVLLVFLIPLSSSALKTYEGDLTVWKQECRQTGGEVVNSTCSCPEEAVRFSNQCWEKTPKQACKEKGGKFMRSTDIEHWVCEDPKAEVYDEIEISPEKYSQTLREISVNESDSIDTGNRTVEENSGESSNGLVSGIIGFISSLF